MGIQTVPCATSPSLSRADPTPAVPLRAVQTTCHGAAPQLTMTKTRNTAFAQVNVSLTRYFPKEIRGLRSSILQQLLLWHADLLIFAFNFYPGSSLHIWRKCWRSWVCLPLHLSRGRIWQLYHRGPQWWLSLVCHHKQLWQRQEVWILSQSWWVTGKNNA